MGKGKHGFFGSEVAEKGNRVAHFLHSERSTLEEAVTKVTSEERQENPDLLTRGGGKMSMESAVAFYECVEKDAALREKLRELGSKEKVAPYVKNELGYDFTEEEMQKVVFEQNPEMTDEDLEAVAGGFWFPFPFPLPPLPETPPFMPIP